MDFIKKELLNQNRVLTMSNNRKCDYLIVDCSMESVMIMGIKDNPYTRDVILIKEFLNSDYNEVIDEIVNICYEFDIHIVLNDKHGFGIKFRDKFLSIVSSYDISIRDIDGNNYNGLSELKKDIESSEIRLLQTYNCGKLSYKKYFLGYSNIMKFHEETDKLMEEVANINYYVSLDGRIKIKMINGNSTSRARFNCLLLYYAYKYEMHNFNTVENIKNTKEDYTLSKRSANYEMIHGIFYKFMFKSIENDKVKIIFYCSGINKFEQFKNIIEEKDFKHLFNDEINQIRSSKDELQIMFNNDSRIKLLYASDSARGNKCHYSVVDTAISKDLLDNIIIPQGVLYDIDKEKMGLTDNYNIEFVEM